MKNKLLSGILAASVSAGVIFAGTGGASAVSDSRSLISIDVDPDTFRDVTNMCCSIYDETDNTEIVKWGSKNGVMTHNNDSTKWNFDLGEHGVELNSTHSYSVVFSDHWDIQTEELIISDYDSAREYTAVFSEIYTWRSVTQKPVFQYQWIGEFDDRAGVDMICVRVDDEAFGTDSTPHCEVYDETEEAYTLLYGRMTIDEDNDVWIFDFGKHGIELINGHRYTVMFNGSEPLTIDSYDRAKDYTAGFTGAFITDEIGNTRARFRWTDEKADILCGDTNGDGIVSVQDVTAIQRHIAGLEPVTGEFLAAADINRDGEVKIDDATLLQMIISEFEFPYGVG